MSVATKFWKQLLAAKSAQDTAAVLPSDLLGTIRELAIYVVFGAGTNAGVVVVEGAHDPAYQGTWANIATINWAAASRVHLAAVSGVHRAVRVRISTGVTGGTVDAYAIGN